MKNTHVNLYKINFLNNYKVSARVMGINIWYTYRYTNYKGPRTVVKDIKPFIDNATYYESHDNDVFLNINSDRFYKILETQRHIP